MSDDSGLPTENLRFSLPACMFFFSINIPVPRLKVKNEVESWDIHRTRLRRKSTGETMETGKISVRTTVAVRKQFLCTKLVNSSYIVIVLLYMYIRNVENL